jgi:hypothetical protein
VADGAGLEVFRAFERHIARAQGRASWPQDDPNFCLELNGKLADTAPGRREPYAAWIT